MMEQDTCVVCAEELDGYNHASCQMCRGKFHQAWNVQVHVPKCGHIVTHDEALAVVFLCRDCYEAFAQE